MTKGRGDLRGRIAQAEGFTLVELLVTLAIVSILLVLAVPLYLGFQERGNTAVAEANVRAAVPAVETFFSDHQTYAGMSVPSLRQIDRGIAVSVEPTSLGASTYCIYASSGGLTYSKRNPGGLIVEGGC
jgi:type IV pilus assembly protein PilA